MRGLSKVAADGERQHWPDGPAPALDEKQRAIVAISEREAVEFLAARDEVAIASRREPARQVLERHAKQLLARFAVG